MTSIALICDRGRWARRVVASLFVVAFIVLLGACIGEAGGTETRVGEDPCEVVLMPAPRSTTSNAESGDPSHRDLVVAGSDTPRLVWHCGLPEDPEPDTVIAAYPRPQTPRAPPRVTIDETNSFQQRRVARGTEKTTRQTTS